MTVMEYIARFPELTRFGDDYVTTDMVKVRRFENGLKLSIRGKIVGLRLCKTREIPTSEKNGKIVISVTKLLFRLKTQNLFSGSRMTKSGIVSRNLTST